MSTQTFIFTAEERRFLSSLVHSAWIDADNKRMLSRVDSPQEKAAQADQEFIQSVEEKLAGRKEG